MRPTLLNFRTPTERTGEYKQFTITNQGNDLDFSRKTVNQSGSVLPKEQRFKDKPMFDKGTGQTCFLGPGSYNDHQSFIDLNKKSCSSKIMPISALPSRESGQQCYIMIGDAIKYEPAWHGMEQKKVLKLTAVNDCLSSATAGLNQSSMSQVQKLKREQYQQSMSRASSGALQPEDVGLGRFSNKTKSISRITSRQRKEMTLTETKYNNLNSYSREQQLKPRNASATQPFRGYTRPQTCSTCSKPYETPVLQNGILNLNSEDFSEQQKILNRPSSMSRHTPQGRFMIQQPHPMRQSAEYRTSSHKQDNLHALNNINIESNDMLGKNESEAIVTVNQKGEPMLPASIEELQDHATASNTTGAHVQAMSVGMSPANLSFQRRGQRSEAHMFEQQNRQGEMMGVGIEQMQILNNYQSCRGNTIAPKKTHLNGERFAQTAKIVSTRRTDPKARSIMPKTAINYYNLRKGLYLKNTGRSNHLQSRQNRKMSGSHDNNLNNAKSVGILNAYGELANLSPQDQEIGGGISSQLNIFHRNKNRNGSQSMALQSMTSPKMANLTTLEQQQQQNNVFVTNPTPGATQPLQLDNEFALIQVNNQQAMDLQPRKKQQTSMSKDLPNYQYSHAAIQRTQKRKKSKRASQPLFYDSALASNSNYMNVIKESHESILRRKHLGEEKRRILNMDFKKRSDKADWDRLNDYLQKRSNQVTADQAENGSIDFMSAGGTPQNTNQVPVNANTTQQIQQQ